MDSRLCSYKYEDNAPCLAWAKRGTNRCRHHPQGTERVPFKQPVSLLEEVVWDALKNSRCPMGHRYEGPGKSLPCRWCRTAHAITLVLIKVQAGEVKPLEVIAQFEKQLGWTLADPVVGTRRC